MNGVAIPIGILPIVAPNYTNAYNWLVSVDYNISDRDQLRGRYVDNKTSAINTAANLPVFFFPRPTTSHLVSLSEFHSFRPNLTNELRLAFNRYNDNIAVPDFQFPGLDVFPNIQIQDDLNVQIGPNPNGPQATIQNTYQINDNVSWTKGRHDFKFGFDGRDLIAASTFIQRVRGDYDYTNLERFLLDKVPDVLAQRNVGGKPYSGNNIALYGFANDNFRVNRNLTLNLGVRYEFNSVRKSMKEFALNSLADVPGVLTFFEPKPQKKNFAPRVGFAYSPGTSATTSIRGGFGMAYDQMFDNVGTNARPPQATSTVDAPVSEVPGFLADGGIKPNAVAGSLTPAAARAATSSWLPDQQVGYAINWNLGVQHVFKKDYTVEARYVGTRGIHLLYQLQLNRAAVVTPTHFLPTLPLGALAGRDRCPAADAGPAHYRAQHAGNRQHHGAVWLHQQRYGVRAARQLGVPRAGTRNDPPLLRPPAFQGRLHLEPHVGRQHRGGQFDDPFPAPSAGLQQYPRRLGLERARSPAARHASAGCTKLRGS